MNQSLELAIVATLSFSIIKRLDLRLLMHKLWPNPPSARNAETIGSKKQTSTNKLETLFVKTSI